jgi:hypothetical protein
MIFVCSRKRRASLGRFFTESQPTIGGRVLIDEDDGAYAGMSLPAGWEFFVRPRAPVSKIINRAYAAFPSEPFYAVVGDDVTCGPHGWDKVLADAAGPHSVSWGDDGRWGPSLCTTFFVGGDLVRRMGWLAHPAFGHLYVDRIWWGIATGAGIAKYHPDISCRHVNVKDTTYRERSIGGDHQQFAAVMAGEMAALIQRASC